ncbi:hypothetical protein L7H23_15455 [Sphingopyxis sp. BSN-002]|uniref:hypothetical protein n=1 Tax=Sphingopyxis sp. BSN-002 TaxID=2911495 RepID=UPI001EDC1717|nr:hypothetical protein [Sphingopyxis sp. BSN-002]UKK83950.1 hypothetical protein L7H23_15455 [Sphingopyxis sp. BSN-002]
MNGRILLLAGSSLALAACQTVESRPIASTLQPAAAGATSSGSGVTPILDGGDCPEGPQPVCDNGISAAPTSPPPAAPLNRATFELNPDDDGMIYFLPRQLAKIVAKRTTKKLSEAVTDVTKAQTALDTAKARQASLEKEQAAIEAQRLAQAGDAGAVAIYDARLKELTPLVAEAKTAAANAQTALKGKTDALAALRIKGLDGDPETDIVTVTVELPPLSADPAFGFRLRALHSIQRDDEHKLIVTPGGLLTSTDVVATDRTGDILVELATIAGAISGAGVGKTALDGSIPPDPCLGAPSEVISIVDFADPADVDQLERDLQCMKIRLRPAAAVQTRYTGLNATARAAPGIATRMPVEVPIRIEQCTFVECGPGDYRLREVRYLPLPQAGPIGFVKQEAGVFTRTQYKLGFKDGVLVSYDANRPSELLEIARTPMRLVDGFFSGFSKIISLRTGRNDEVVSMSASELAKMMALARDQSAAEAFLACVRTKTAAGESFDACMPTS